METLYRAGLSNAVSATVLALLIACLGRVLWRRPAVMHCLWLLVLLKLVTPPLYDVSVPWISGMSIAPDLGWEGELFVVESDQEAATISADDDFDWEMTADSAPARSLGQPEAEPKTTLRSATAINWQRMGGLIWITGTFVTMTLAFGRIRRFQSLLHQAQPADADTQEWVDELAASLGLTRSPSVWWVAGKLSPLVWSLGWRPRLVLPRELWKSLDEHQRASLIIHELAHLRRGDHLLRFFELFVTALYWWHPVLWWARRSMRDVEEQCCDAWVVWALPNATKSYADTLLETLDFLDPCDLTEPLLASGFGKVHHLRKRLTMIMTGTTPRLLGMWGTLGTLALAVLLLPVNASLAQKPDEKKSIETKEVRVVVADDGAANGSADNEVRVVVADGVASASADASASAGGTDALTFTTAVEGAEPGRFFVTVKSDDDSKGSIITGSLGEAAAKLKAQIEEINKKSPQTDGDKARRKGLEHAIKSLEQAAEQIRKHPADSDKARQEKGVRAVVIRRDKLDKNVSPEKRAEIEQAAAKVAELAEALKAKQKELMEARQKLSKLQGSLAVARITRADSALLAQDLAARARYVSKAPMTVRVPQIAERKFTLQRDGEGGEKRIEALEKKLEKLLEEVASLKNDRAK